MQQQQRIDASDGTAYGLEEFLECYGAEEGWARWKSAAPAPAAAAVPQPPAPPSVAAAAPPAAPPLQQQLHAPAPILFVSEDGRQTEAFAAPASVSPHTPPHSAMRPVAPAPSPPEHRIDPTDGLAYPLEDFVVCYGEEEGLQRWATAHPLSPQQQAVVAAVKAADDGVPAEAVRVVLTHPGEGLGIEYECASYGPGEADVVRVTRTMPGGACERAGLPPGILANVNGVEVQNVEDLRQAVALIRQQQRTEFDIIIHPVGEPREALAVGSPVPASPPRSRRSPTPSLRRPSPVPPAPLSAPGSCGAPPASPSARWAAELPIADSSSVASRVHQRRTEQRAQAVAWQNGHSPPPASPVGGHSVVGWAYADPRAVFVSGPASPAHGCTHAWMPVSPAAACMAPSPSARDAPPSVTFAAPLDPAALHTAMRTEDGTVVLQTTTTYHL